MNARIFLIFFYSVCAADLLGCVRTPDAQTAAVPRYLYVSSGQCYSGTGNTTFTNVTSSNLIYRVSLETGVRDLLLADYSAFPASSGDSPVGIVDWDSNHILALVENPTSGRRIEKVPKSTEGERAVFTSNSTILSSVLRGLTKLSDGSILVNKSSGVEKLSSSGARIGLPFMGNTLGATCGTTITQMTALQSLSNGKILFSHAAASNNRFGLVSAAGYSTAADCLAAQAAPIATAYPVAAAYISSTNQVIVAYAANAVTTNLNSIYLYDINETSNTISNATRLYDASLYPGTYNYLLYGISAMTFDTTDNSLYVSTAINTATTVTNYSIEKLTFDSAAKTLTRVGGTPFYNYGVDTKCISSMFIGL